MALCLIASVTVGRAATAGEDPALAPPTIKLKWRARSPVTQRPSQAGDDTRAAGFEARPTAAQEPGARAKTRSSRARTRDSVMQVSNESDPLNDPFPDSGLPNTRNGQEKAEAIDEPAATRESEPIEPSPLPTDRDRSSEDAVPSPPPTRTPFPSEPLPPGDLSQGLSTPGAVGSCDEYKNSECSRAVRELERKDITKIYVGLFIEGVENDDYPCNCPLQSETFKGRCYSPTMFTWKATGVCHKPLYFEDVQLERYGHSWNPVLQPFMSAAHFFVSVPLLPYNMGVNPPSECIYTLGYYRPGSCAPYVIEPIPWSLRGAVFEVGAATGFGFWFWPVP